MNIQPVTSESPSKTVLDGGTIIMLAEQTVASQTTWQHASIPHSSDVEEQVLGTNDEAASTDDRA
eukprot:14571477-Ditylum_brightwellii.AAC.1